MLFYEPLFLFLFFPIVLAAFLAVQHWAGLRAAVLLAASVFFYLWSEPLFVPVVVATCWADYRLSRALQAAPGAAFGWPGRADQCRHPGLLQIHRLRRRQPGRAAGSAGPAALACGRDRAADRRVLHRVREDHLPGGHPPRPQQPGAGLRRYLLYVLPVPQAARRPDHQIPRAGGADLASGRIRPCDLAPGSAVSCWAW